MNDEGISLNSRCHTAFFDIKNNSVPNDYSTPKNYPLWSPYGVEHSFPGLF